MTHPNFDLIDQFFDGYGQRDLAALRAVLAEEVVWVFPGGNRFSGTHRGVEGGAAFFDDMGGIMGQSKVKAETLFRGANDDYVLESQQVQITRAEGHNLDHQWCVRWAFKDGEIVEGRRFASDPYAADEFFGML